jgi:sugar lactone lactonase YvrE
LNGISYPHGLRFSPDGKALYVADAGAPLVHKFDAPDGNWAIDATPSNSVPVLSEQVFLAGRHNEQEGGPKGLDLDSSGTIMAITCEEQPLAFFSVERLFG